MLEFIIIGMVLDKPGTGYDIKKHIENGIGVFYKASYGSLYPALKKLYDKGFLTMTEQPAGSRKKKYYMSTEKGKNAFYEWLSSPLDSAGDSNNTLVKVFFFDRLEQHIREILLKEYELKHLTYLRKLMELEKHFSKMENQDCFYFKLSTLYYGIKIVQDNINWCRHLLKREPLKNFIEEMI